MGFSLIGLSLMLNLVCKYDSSLLCFCFLLEILEHSSLLQLTFLFENEVDAMLDDWMLGSSSEDWTSLMSGSKVKSHY